METQTGDGESLILKSTKNKRKQWTPADDSKLQELVSLKGPTDWPTIAKKLANAKNGKQCRKRLVTIFFSVCYYVIIFVLINIIIIFPKVVL